MDSALLGVLVGGLIGLAAQLLAAHLAARHRWAETRREVYSEYLELISVGRRRLEAEARRRLAGEPDHDVARTDRHALREQAVAGWNRVRLLSRSSRLHDAARELQVRVAELDDMLSGRHPLQESDLVDNLKAYERHRTGYVEAAQHEVGLR